MYPPAHRGRSRYWVARGNVNGRRLSFVTKETELEPAKRIVDLKIKHELLGPEASGEFKVDGDAPPVWARKMMHAAIWRSKQVNATCNLTIEDMLYLAKRANGHCEFTGLAFSSEAFRGNARRRPFAPSLDRIEPEKGYTRENCRFVLFCVNVAMSDWGPEALRRVALAITFRDGLTEGRHS